jgi:uncharacterized membrane protein
MSLAPSPLHSMVPSRDRSSRGGLAPRPTTNRQTAASSHASVNVRSSERIVSTLAGGLAVGWGLSKQGPAGKLIAALGSALVYRGVSGHCHVYQALGVDSEHGTQHAPKIDVLRSVTAQRSAQDVFRAWRRPETFAQVLGHFASHTSLEGGRTQWTLHDPMGREHSWVTEVVAEEPNKMIRWQTVDGAPLLKSLTLQLHPAPGDRGTEMRLHLRLEPPSGVLGSVLGKLFGKAPAWVIDRALRNMKSLLEAGEVPSLKNNPAARASART